jgi:hypothetical protein
MGKNTEKKVTYELFRDNKDYKDDVFVCVNGRGMQIKRGEKVQIPESFAEVLDHSLNQDRKTAELMDKKQNEFFAESAKQNIL